MCNPGAFLRSLLRVPDDGSLGRVDDDPHYLGNGSTRVGFVNLWEEKAGPELDRFEIATALMAEVIL